MTFGEKLRSARTAKKLTQNKLANLIGAKNTAISNWEKDINKPDIDTLALICKALGVSATYFIENKEPSFSLKENDIIKKYRTLDEYGKEAVDNILDVEHRRCTAESKPETIKVLTAARSVDGQTPIRYEEMTREEYEKLINAPETDEDF